MPGRALSDAQTDAVFAVRRKYCEESTALERVVTLALANKESLVAAGDLALAARERGGGVLLPVDSERDRNDYWHTDVTFMERPPMASILYASVMPECGGDTMWSNLQAAYDTLAGNPPISTVTGKGGGCGEATVAIAPFTPAGLVSPWPVA